jgi:hypothetical protein
MAGNVTAEVRDGHLYVTGDSAANEIEIISRGVVGQFEIRGLDGTTRVNGSLGPITLSGVMGGAYIYLNGGHDRVELSNFYTFGDVTIDGGLGNDRLYVGTGSLNNHVGVNLNISGGAGMDRVTVANTDVGNNAVIDGESDRDVLVVTSWRQDHGRTAARVAGNLRIVGGFTRDAADNEVWVIGQTFGSLNVHGSGARDSVAILECDAASAAVDIFTNSGHDQVLIADSRFDMLSIYTDFKDVGNNDDTVGVYRCEVGGIFIYTGVGRDRITIEDVRAPGLRIESGDPLERGLEDSDTVVIRSLRAGEFFAELGEDDDSISLTDVSAFYTELHGDGGSGDWLYLFGSNSLGMYHSEGFEHFWSDVVLEWFSDAFYWEI